MNGLTSTGGRISSLLRRRLQDNLKRVNDTIAEAALSVRRDPREVQLVAVTKTVDPEVIRILLELGQVHLAENRVQQLVQRASMLKEHYQRRLDMGELQQPPPVRWHMVGHLQRNKVKPLLPWVHLIHSVDTLRLGEEINNQARKLNRVQEVFLQVKCVDEPQKFGVPVAAASYLAEQLNSLPHLKVTGLMTMAPLTDDPEQSRAVFERLEEIFLDIRRDGELGPEFKHLSMGMSQDYAVAVQCGATVVRIGSALFEGLQRQL